MQSSDGNFIAVGSSNSFNDSGRFDFFVVKFDTYGNVIWTKTFPFQGADSENYLAKNVFETSYGSYLLAGPRLSGSAPADEAFVVEFIYPTPFNLSFESDSHTLTSPPYEVQFMNNTPGAEYFDFVWYFGDGASLASNDSIVSHTYTNDGLFDVTLIAYENDFGSVDTLLLKDYINVQGIGTSVNNIGSRLTANLTIHPNPFSNTTVIRFNNPDNDVYALRIMDQSGKLVKEIGNIRGSSVELSRNNLPSGIYFLELYGKTSSRARLVIE